MPRPLHVAALPRLQSYHYSDHDAINFHKTRDSSCQSLFITVISLVPVETVAMVTSKDIARLRRVLLEYEVFPNTISRA